MRRPLGVLGAAALGAALYWGLSIRREPLGRLHRDLAAEVSPDRIGRQMATLASRPHRAGTEANRAVGDEIRKRLAEAGFAPESEEHTVTLIDASSVALELVKPAPLAFDLREKAFPQVPDTAVAETEVPSFAFSPEADVTAPVIYASFGDRSDYELLKSKGIDPRGKIALVRAQGLCRGMKAQIAEEMGVRALLLFPELRDQGFRKVPFPEGPHLNLWTAQRGTLLRYFVKPGTVDESTLSRVPALPITQATAVEILSRLEGEPANEDWKGWLDVPYRLGVGPAEVHLTIRNVSTRRTLRNLFARIEGEVPEAPPIVVGAHYDAWVYGAVDPCSGAAVVLETAAALKKLSRSWWKPRRSIVFAFWDGEEYGMFGSTHWLEKRLAARGASSIAVYVNVDSSVRNTDFVGNVSPGVRGSLDEALSLVEEPFSGRRLFELRGELGMPGFSSDTAPFSGLAGIPVSEIGFGRWYSVYHSVYDDPTWLRKFGDPGFALSGALAQVLGVYLGALTRDDLLPWRLSEVATFGRRALTELRSAQPASRESTVTLDALDAEIARFEGVAVQLEGRLRKSKVTPAEAARLNPFLQDARLAFLLSEEAQPIGRRDLVFGVSDVSGCAGEALPALSRSLRGGGRADVDAAATSLTKAFEAARAALKRAGR